ILLTALVWGPSTCPTPEQVDRHLSLNEARQLVVELSEQPDGLHLVARNPAGDGVVQRVVPLLGDCDARAAAAAAFIRTAPRLRTPLHTVVRQLPVSEAPKTEALEVSGELGAVMSPAPRALLGRVWLQRAPHGGPFTVFGVLSASAGPQREWQVS